MAREALGRFVAHPEADWPCECCQMHWSRSKSGSSKSRLSGPQQFGRCKKTSGCASVARQLYKALERSLGFEALEVSSPASWFNVSFVDQPCTPQFPASMRNPDSRSQSFHPQTLHAQSPRELQAFTGMNYGALRHAVSFRAAKL